MENGPLWRSIRAPHFSGRNDFTTGYRRPKPVKRVCRLSPSKQDQLKSMFRFYECFLMDQFRFKMYGWSLWNGNETNQTLVTWWCGFHKLMTSLITSNDDINHVQVLMEWEMRWQFWFGHVRIWFALLRFSLMDEEVQTDQHGRWIHREIARILELNSFDWSISQISFECGHFLPNVCK